MDDDQKTSLRQWVLWFKEFKYKSNFSFILETDLGSGWPKVELKMMVPDARFVPSYEGQPTPIVPIRSKYVLGPWEDERYANNFIRGALRQMEDHELDEWFLVKGERVFDPHG